MHKQPWHYITNRRRLMVQWLDAEAQRLLREAVQVYVAAELAKLEAMPRQRALDRLRGHRWTDDGAFMAKSVERRRRAALGLLEAFT